MSRVKVYKVDMVRFVTTVKLPDDNVVSITFSGGTVYPMARPAIFQTEDQLIQAAIESSPLFNTTIFLEYDSGAEEKVKSDEVDVVHSESEETEEHTTSIEDAEVKGYTIVPEVTTYQQAKEYLIRLENVKYKDVAKKADILRVAEENKIFFPNLK